MRLTTAVLAVIVAACTEPVPPDVPGATETPMPATDKPATPPGGKTDPRIVPADLMQRIRADVVKRAGGAESDIVVVHAQAARWNDGALGCPEPGMGYTQALVDGFWVVLRHGGREWDYRTRGTGHFRLCEHDGRPPMDPPDDPLI